MGKRDALLDLCEVLGRSWLRCAMKPGDLTESGNVAGIWHLGRKQLYSGSASEADGGMSCADTVQEELRWVARNSWGFCLSL